MCITRRAQNVARAASSIRQGLLGLDLPPKCRAMLEPGRLEQLAAYPIIDGYGYPEHVVIPPVDYYQRALMVELVGECLFVDRSHRHVDQLLDKELCSIRDFDLDGDSLLASAVQCNDAESVRYLLSRGADPASACSANGMTAYDWNDRLGLDIFS